MLRARGSICLLFTLPSASSCLTKTRNSKTLHKSSNWPKLAWTSDRSVQLVHGCRTCS